MIAALFASLSLQAASDVRIVCVSDPATGDVTVSLLARRAGQDGLWLSRHGDWVVPDLDERPDAEGLDWYREGRPIVRDGEVYMPRGVPHAVGGAVNRYYRHVGLHDGAPLFSVWPGGDVDLAVLVTQEDCVFRVYGREDRTG